MDIAIRHQPGFAVARLALAEGETIRAEAGALMATVPSVQVEATAESGLMRSLNRVAHGGKSFFITYYTAPPGGGWVDVAAFLPGDINVVNVLSGQAWIVQKGSWLAGASTIEIDTKPGGFTNLFGSDGGFLLRAAGHGPMVLAAYGAIEAWDLEAGQTITVDTGHMVAYTDGTGMKLRKVTGGPVQTYKSGEGLVFDFTGPGRLLVQSRNPEEFLGFISAAVGAGDSS